MKKKILAVLGLASLVTLVLTACSSSGSKTDGKTTLTVATDSDTAPFTYKKGSNFTGYDIDVLNAIFKGSDKYKVKFVTTAFASILTGVDADRYQIAANDFNYNKERAEKYLFSDSISKSNYAIVSKEGVNYSSLEELSGKSTEVLSGSNYAQILEQWNTNNPSKTPIKINYVSGSTGLTTRMQHIENGTVDFVLYDAISAKYIISDQGFNLAVTNVKDSIGGSTDGLEYLLFSDSNQGKEIKKFVNKRIAVLKKDGTFTKLSKKYFGGDFVPKDK